MNSDVLVTPVASSSVAFNKLYICFRSTRSQSVLVVILRLKDDLFLYRKIWKISSTPEPQVPHWADSLATVEVSNNAVSYHDKNRTYIKHWVQSFMQTNSASHLCWAFLVIDCSLCPKQGVKEVLSASRSVICMTTDIRYDFCEESRHKLSLPPFEGKKPLAKLLPASSVYLPTWDWCSQNRDLLYDGIIWSWSGVSFLELDHFGIT